MPTVDRGFIGDQPGSLAVDMRSIASSPHIQSLLGSVLVSTRTIDRCSGPVDRVASIMNLEGVQCDFKVGHPLCFHGVSRSY